MNRRLDLIDGGCIDFLTCEMEPMAFEGSDWDLAWIDEPIPEDRYYAILRGLMDRGGPVYFTFTPLIEPWMKEHLVDRADGVAIDVVEADTYENTSDIHGSPILSAKDIKALEDAMPEELRDARIHGRFFHLKGIVYKEFNPAMHIREFRYEAPDPVIAVLDPHDRQPHHVLWAWIDRNDCIHIDDELVMNGTVLDLKKAILLREQRNGYRMVRRLIDPNFGRKPLITTGRTVIQELARNPFPVRFGEANDDKVAGHLKVKDYLHYDPTKKIELTNSPRLFFHRTRVPQSLHSIRNYQFDEWRGKTANDRDPKEKEKQKDTHGADCIRYLCMSNPTFDLLNQVHANEPALEMAPY